MLKCGDPCPFCGQQIKTSDPAILELLTLVAQRRYFPTFDEIRAINDKEAADAE